MSKQDKRLKAWLAGKQDVPRDEVEAVIDRYFPDCKKKEGTSHLFMISHPKLNDVPDFAPNGTFLIPVRGKVVHWRYAKILAKAIQIITDEA